MEKKIKFLENLLSEKRLSKLNQVLDSRVDSITIVLEDLFDPHNISAVIRTAEGLGIQDIHIIENKSKFEINKGISKYSHKWISIHKYNSSEECIINLKNNGYQICVSTLNEFSVSLYDIEIDKANKIAFVLGSEHDGVSEEMLKLSDTSFIIPMTGFTQSFNVSVAAAIILHYSLNKKRISIEKQGTLSNEKKTILYKEWVIKSVKHSEKILKANKIEE